MINRYTLAGLLSVLGVVGVLALGVWAVGAADNPSESHAATDVAAQPSVVPLATATPAQGTATATATPADGKATATPTATAKPDGQLPAQKTKDLVQAAKLAGCTLKTEPDEGATHVPGELTAADYGTNPPTSGMHNPEWASDGAYPPGNTPDLGTLVHTLEHGRINIQYAPGTDPAIIANLGKLGKAMDGGYHLLLYQNTTDMPFAVAATAWDQLLGCPQMNDNVYDAIRAFRATYIDQGPETVP